MAAYGGVFVAGSLAWDMVVDGFRARPVDVIGALALPGRRRRDHVRASRVNPWSHSQKRSFVRGVCDCRERRPPAYAHRQNT
ncbi:hypothetical protein ACIBH1_12095 [Nonomuraea sp. NPDC050663]|uniref:hypothetical protein n=1 Tax=Nonomuraea sp. NPDC050663 TaxID=3364370 RepID=UPI0037AE380B